MPYRSIPTILQQFSLFALTWLWTVAPARADIDDDDDNDYDPLPGRTEAEIEALIFNLDEVIETIALYTALFALSVMLLSLAGSMRMRRWVGYTLLSIASLAWFACYEQYPTNIFWIGITPTLSVLALTGIPVISAHFLFAGWTYPQDGSLRWMRALLFGMAATPVIALALAWPVQDNQIPLSLIVLALMGAASHLLSMPRRDKDPSRLIYTRRNLVVVTVGLAFTGFIIFGELDEGFDASFAIRSLFVLVVLLFAFFLVQSVITILKERDASQRAALAIAQREVAQATALLEAEKKYARAKEAARLHTQRLANASHDIRQPITSLRATMAAVAKDQPDEVQTQLRTAFDYLDQLAQSYMETEDAPNAPIKPQDGVETFSSKMLCDTLERMFRDEAEAKQLEFRTNVEDEQLKVSPLVITRILSNLLSNAIQHTATGHIGLYARKVMDGYEIAVQNTALMPQDEDPNELFAHGQKGSASKGSGFGLSIIEQLAKTNSLTLDWSSSRPDGTEFRIGIPLETSS